MQSRLAWNTLGKGWMCPHRKADWQWLRCADVRYHRPKVYNDATSSTVRILRCMTWRKKPDVIISLDSVPPFPSLCCRF